MACNEEKTVHRIRIVLALESPLLCEVLRDLIQQEPDLEVVAEADDPVDLLLTVDLTKVNVFIHSWESHEVPAICSHLLTEYPDLLVIGIPPNADLAYACRQAIAKTKFPTARLQDVLSEIRRPRAMLQ